VNVSALRLRSDVNSLKLPAFDKRGICNAMGIVGVIRDIVSGAVTPVVEKNTASRYAMTCPSVNSALVGVRCRAQNVVVGCLNTLINRTQIARYIPTKL